MNFDDCQAAIWLEEAFNFLIKTLDLIFCKSVKYG